MDLANKIKNYKKGFYIHSQFEETVKHLTK